MRAWLLVCAALALAPRPAPRAAAHTPAPPATLAPLAPLPPRLERIKSQILAKLGLSSRPTPLGAPPRDVVRQILARATDPRPPHRHHDTDNEHAMREIIAIAHRGTNTYIHKHIYVQRHIKRTLRKFAIKDIQILTHIYIIIYTIIHNKYITK